MSQVGVAACPKCGARYGVQESAAGQTLPCPACGTKFVVQPVARAPDDFLPPSVDLAAGGPIVPATRVLDPVVYPHRDIPWTLIAIGTGLCLVLGLILYGGWQAYRAIDAVVANTTFEPNESATASAEAATGAAADVADQVAADAAAAVQGAGKVIDRIAGAVTDSVELPKILPDSHERLTDERERLQADYLRIRDEFAGGQQSETAKKLLDLQLRTEDLAIRWYVVPPMSEGELDRLKPRLLEQMQRGFGGQPLGEHDPAFDSDPSVRVVAVGLNNSERSVTLAIAMAADGQQPQDPHAQQQVQLAATSRELCRQLYTVRSIDDVGRVAPRVHEEIARIKAAAGQVEAVSPIDQVGMQRAAKLMAHLTMAAMVCNHVSTRFGLARTNPSTTEENRTAAQIEVTEFEREFGKLVSEFHLAYVEFAKAAISDRPPSVAIAASGPGAIPMPGFGVPGGFGPAGFGPPGFGPGAFGPHPSPSEFSDASVDADFEAKRQAFIQRHGADQTLTVRANGGTEGQNKALEATIMRLVRPRGHSMSRTGSHYQLSVVFAGDVERIAAAITSGKVTSTDVNGRLITVEFK